jgi:hypothetical protein
MDKKLTNSPKPGGAWITDLGGSSSSDLEVESMQFVSRIRIYEVDD